ncbi:FtsX-like permease family protein [Niastella caeni]|uniref:FtsX-like permease family protein n=1 Tax=Niastella caeni TaxID=2569763 RepID=A0A4S8HRX7_9BACT|nr:ABC transporter permease [Niastella caeni]THU38213.1 FtsX-like permease family protein [Niastella caeni]
MFRNYLKTAWRNLQHNKVYSAINIGGIAIGVATFWLIGLYVIDEMSYDRSFANANRIFRVAQHATWQSGSMNIVPTSAPFANAFKITFPEVEDAARIDIEGGGVIKYADKTIKEDHICFADNSLLNLFDYHFLYGNSKTALVQPQSIVITKTLAVKIFGDASKAINQTILFGSNSYPNKVTGVIEDMLANSHLQFSGLRSFGDALNMDGWNNTYLYTYLLLNKSSDITSLLNKLPSFENKLAKQLNYTQFHIELQPLTSIHLYSNLDYELSNNGSISRVYTFIVIGILILLIALINYMNLSTARASTRVKEIGIRKVIGSERRHLIVLFISEALLVTFIAAILACFLVQFSLPFFNQLSGKNIGIWNFGTVNTIACISIFALITGFISGSYPALFLSRFKLIPSLKGQLGSMHGNIILRKSLVVFQFVIAVCLISGSYIIYKQMQYVSQKKLGFNKEQVLTFHIDDMKVRTKTSELKHDLLQNGLIEDAAVVGNPIGNNDLNKNGFRFERNGEINSSSQLANKLYVDEDFIKTMDIHLLQGRNFSKDISTDKEDAVLINETLMKTLGYTNAIGKKMQYPTPSGTVNNMIIVGVVKDFHAYSLQHKIEPMVMMMPPNDKEKDNLYVKLAKGKTAQAIAYLKNTYTRFDKKNTADFHFLDENFQKQYAGEQKQEQLSLSFTVLAFIIACLGLLGLVTFATAQRKKEIGVRKVLGATVQSVTILLSREFAKLLFVAAIIAIPVSWFIMDKWLQDFAYRINIEWWMLMLTCSTTIFIALITVSFQAIKAAIINPAKSLRTE